LKKSDFHFDLPPELIAQQPLPTRSASRLLVADAGSHAFEDRRFAELVDLLQPGDLLVFNDTRVLPARLFGRKDSGGAVEILIERITGTHEARAQLGVSKKPKAGGRIILQDGSEVSVLGRDGEFFILRFDTIEPIEKVLLRLGRMPLPPYIERDADNADDERYQTVFARTTGGWRHRRRACTSMTNCCALWPRAASNSATSPCMSGPARFSRCARSASKTTRCIASGSM
jgi:S-adenosylmethionine:tRNA ribosyltransferase-isomerase